MKRIHIIGGAGSGKTTLARQLATHFGYSCFDLDTVAWHSTGKVPLVERLTAVNHILSHPAWITEGVFLWWTEPLLSHADHIIWLDLPFPLRAWRIVKRHAQASWRGHNPHAGLGNLLRFLRSVAHAHYTKNPLPPAAPDDDFAITRAGTAVCLTPYQPNHLSPMATSKLETSSTNATGAQIARSTALGVIKLSTRLTTANATASHTSRRDVRAHLWIATPARASTRAANSSSTAPWTRAATRRAGGNWPGKAPPMAYAPQGTPNASAI